MSPTNAKIRAAELRIPFDVAESYFAQERELADADHARRKALRAWIHSRYGGPAAFYSRFHRGRGGDFATIPQWDVWAAAAAAEWPEIVGGDDPAQALWDFIASPADRAPTAAELWGRAFERAAADCAARDVATLDDMLPIADAAALADVTPQWLRALVRSGRIPGRRIGSAWVVSRTAALAFKRHPTAGRPRRSADVSAVPF